MVRLPIVGEFKGAITFQNKREEVTIQVLKGNHGSLLSYKTAIALGIHINQVKTNIFSHDIEKKFPNIFNGIGN